MKLAYFLKEASLQLHPSVLALLADLGAAGFDVYPASGPSDITPGTSMLLSFGGDGTYLSAASLALGPGLPVLGVNFGRLGFLSENAPEDVSSALLEGNYEIEERGLLSVRTEGGALPGDMYPFALNEVSVHRRGASILGISVSVDGAELPEFWADGLLVATSSGSTAYSLSAGGPICMPDARVLIIAPVAPHNLNVRPLVVPDTSRIGIRVSSRDPEGMLSVDNRSAISGNGLVFEVSMAQFSLKRVRLPRSGFVKALTEKLFWGEDIRNSK